MSENASIASWTFDLNYQFHEQLTAKIMHFKFTQFDPSGNYNRKRISQMNLRCFTDLKHL